MLLQRGPLRESGLDPDAVELRRADVVEGYEQWPRVAGPNILQLRGGTIASVRASQESAGESSEDSERTVAHNLPDLTRAGLDVNDGTRR